jgi:hypothetical protein
MIFRRNENDMDSGGSGSGNNFGPLLFVFEYFHFSVEITAKFCLNTDAVFTSVGTVIDSASEKKVKLKTI